ncbi:predicted protein [Botrytis cinerea T4]|uniref:Uncharacterized protein n=1 Tax=Botryotinia fuckeliana (strain T4) TaxID=999810 RepID=G2Y4J6_BOTF4|nr:predicted protein [Botrytis cinerea T4]
MEENKYACHRFSGYRETLVAGPSISIFTCNKTGD